MRLNDGSKTDQSFRAVGYAAHMNCLAAGCAAQIRKWLCPRRCSPAVASCTLLCLDFCTIGLCRPPPVATGAFAVILRALTRPIHYSLKSMDVGCQRVKHGANHQPGPHKHQRAARHISCRGGKQEKGKCAASGGGMCGLRGGSKGGRGACDHTTAFTAVCMCVCARSRTVAMLCVDDQVRISFRGPLSQS